jgi:hypothetical protein
MRLNKTLAATSVAILLVFGFANECQHFNTFAQSAQTVRTVGVAVGPQYDTTYVYVAPQDFDRLVASLIATFGAYDAVASVECDAGKAIEPHESRPDQRIKVADGLTPAEMTFVIPGPRCPLWVSH